MEYFLLHPLLNLAFKPTGGSAHFYWLRETTFAYQLIEPLVGQTGELRNEFHVDQLVIQQGRVFRYHDECSPLIKRRAIRRGNECILVLLIRYLPAVINDV
jgi:hypothetical protein